MESEETPVKEEKDGMEVLTPKHEKWKGIKKAIDGELVSVDSIKKQYSISEEDEVLLTTPDKK